MNKYLVKRLGVNLFTYEAESDTATKISNVQVAAEWPKDYYLYGHKVYRDFIKDVSSGEPHSLLLNKHGCELYADNDGQWQQIEIKDPINPEKYWQEWS